MSSQIKVYLRVRPSKQEGGYFSVIPAAEPKEVEVMAPKSDDSTGLPSNKQSSWRYAFDGVLDARCSQQRTFETVAMPMVDAALDGFNGTVLCYGQTGAGKSFTTVGSREDYNQRGIVARAIAHAFREAANRPEFEYKIKIACLEIYNDSMRDLLASADGPRQELALSEQRGRVEIKGLTRAEVEDEQAALEHLFAAETQRIVAHHQLNSASSRSHVLYLLHIERRSRVAPNGALTVSKLTLVDLAGSERLKKTGGGLEASAVPGGGMGIGGMGIAA